MIYEQLQRSFAALRMTPSGFLHSISCRIFDQRVNILERILYPPSVSVGNLKLGRSLGGSDCNNLVAINKEDARILSRLIGFVKVLFRARGLFRSTTGGTVHSIAPKVTASN
jgi:hypothetical protein